MNENASTSSPADEPAMDQQSEVRIGRILRKTQREVGTRDLLTFTFGRAWSVLLILGATFVVIADQVAKNVDSDT